MPVPVPVFLLCRLLTNCRSDPYRAKGHHGNRRRGGRRGLVQQVRQQDQRLAGWPVCSNTTMACPLRAIQRSVPCLDTASTGPFRPVAYVAYVLPPPPWLVINDSAHHRPGPMGASHWMGRCDKGGPANGSQPEQKWEPKPARGPVRSFRASRSDPAGTRITTGLSSGDEVLRSH